MKNLTAASLADLAATVNALTDSEGSEYDLTSLPTFGGDEPSDTTGIWSWDADSLLIGEGRPFKIVSRAEYAALMGA